MNRMTLTLAKDALKKDYRWLPRDYRKGEQVYLVAEQDYSCIGGNGLVVVSDNSQTSFELPMLALAFEYEEKEFDIFMTEQSRGKQYLYCKELTIDRLNLLTKIQSNHHLKRSGATKPDYSGENQILKIAIADGQVQFEKAQLENIEPLI